MPIYEFRCEACGERFEALVAAGTDSVECREVKNAQLRERARTEFTSARRRARERRRKGGSGG